MTKYPNKDDFDTYEHYLIALIDYNVKRCMKENNNSKFKYYIAGLSFAIFLFIFIGDMVLSRIEKMVNTAGSSIYSISMSNNNVPLLLNKKSGEVWMVVERHGLLYKVPFATETVYDMINKRNNYQKQP